MALVAHLSGVLNTFKIFGVPAAAPILLNIVFLAGLVIFVAWQHSEVPAHVLAWCVAIAGEHLLRWRVDGGVRSHMQQPG